MQPCESVRNYPVWRSGLITRIWKRRRTGAETCACLAATRNLAFGRERRVMSRLRLKTAGSSSKRVINSRLCARVVRGREKHRNVTSSANLRAFKTTSGNIAATGLGRRINIIGREIGDPLWTVRKDAE